MIIDEHGYITKDNSYIYDTISTTDRIKESLYNIEITAEAMAENIQIIAWIRIQDESELNNEIISMIETGVSSISKFGMIASIVNNYRKSQLIMGKESILNAYEFNAIDSAIMMTRQKTVVTYINNYKPIHFKGNLMNFISEDAHHILCYRKKGFKMVKGKQYNLNGVYEKIIKLGKFNPVIVKHYKLT